jgi:hypothetical protein
MNDVLDLCRISTKPTQITLFLVLYSLLRVDSKKLLFKLIADRRFLYTIYYKH